MADDHADRDEREIGSPQLIDRRDHRRTGDPFRRPQYWDTILPPNARCEAMFSSEGIVEVTPLIGERTIATLTPHTHRCGVASHPAFLLPPWPR